jgi:hypothetical protein
MRAAKEGIFLPSGEFEYPEKIIRTVLYYFGYQNHSDDGNAKWDKK